MTFSVLWSPKKVELRREFGVTSFRDEKTPYVLFFFREIGYDVVEILNASARNFSDLANGGNMKTRKNHIPIFTSVTNENLPYLMVTLKSVSEHLGDDWVADVRVLTAGLAVYNMRKLRHAHIDNVEITVIDVNSKVEDYRADFEERLGYFLKEESFYPFFIADVYTRLARALYIECGTLVRDSIEKLYHVDLGCGFIGGLKRTDGIDASFDTYRSTWVGVNPSVYIDTSVMLMNFSAFRKYRISSRFARLLMGYNFDTVSAASDYMNFLCKGHVSVLNDVWQRDDGSEGIVSFSPYRRPWHYVNEPYADEFWDTARRTPFYDDVRNAYFEFNDEKKAKEERELEEILLRAEKLSKSPDGFYHVLGENYLIE